MSESEDEKHRRPAEPRFRRVARRIFRDIDRELHEDEPEGPTRPEASEGGYRADSWALLGAVLETGDKAKTEMVRMLAREVRTYLEALELHKDLHHLLTNYSLEVKASIHLKPLADAIAPTPPRPGAAGSSPETPAPDESSETRMARTHSEK